MQIHAIQDLSNNYVINLLKTSLSEITDSDIITNYHPDYANIPGNLFYVLSDGRYKKGNYFVLEDGGQYLGSSGWNEYNDLALIMTRTYVPPKFRSRQLIAKHITVPITFKETAAYTKLWITCNEHNKSIYNMIERMKSGNFSGVGPVWKKLYSQFSPIGMHVVNNTLQYVAELNKLEKK